MLCRCLRLFSLPFTLALSHYCFDLVFNWRDVTGSVAFSPLIVQISGHSPFQFARRQQQTFIRTVEPEIVRGSTCRAKNRSTDFIDIFYLLLLTIWRIQQLSCNRRKGQQTGSRSCGPPSSASSQQLGVVTRRSGKKLQETIFFLLLLPFDLKGNKADIGSSSIKKGRSTI